MNPPAPSHWPRARWQCVCVDSSCWLGCAEDVRRDPCLTDPVTVQLQVLALITDEQKAAGLGDLLALLLGAVRVIGDTIRSGGYSSSKVRGGVASLPERRQG